MPEMSVQIDRMILNSLDVTPERAEHMRALVQGELQRMLERGGWQSGMTDGEISRMNAPTMSMAELHSDNRLAHGLAQRILQSLHGVSG